MTADEFLTQAMSPESGSLQDDSMLRLLWSAVAQAKEAILITSADLNMPGPEILFVNPAFTQMTGYSQKEVLHKTPRVLQGSKTNREMLKQLRESLSQGRVFSGETVNYRKDGSEYFVEWDIAPVHGTDGHIAYFISVQRNVTERKEAELRLAELFRQVEKSRNDLLSILNELRLGTAMADPAGRIVFLSEAAEGFFGRKNSAAWGRPWDEILPLVPEDTEKLRRQLQQPESQRTKLPVQLAIGEERRRWLEIEVKDDPRDARGKIFFLYDVTAVHDLRSLLDQRARFNDLLGKSAVMQRVYQQIRDVARVDSTVLIEGETGTGKELVARAIHASSPRQQKPFIAVNCAGLTDSLLSSELFGHKRGAFTGAIEDHQGLFEAAHMGTLFLDEIGDIPSSVQNQLLRVLQEREIVRLGETRPRKIDVRVLAATHRKLTEELAAGRFRSDLLYRIRVARIAIPPLRERREDIPLLAAAFLAQSNAASGKNVEQISPAASRFLSEYPWPGNVRELKSAIEFAVIQCQSSVVQVEDLPPEIRNPQEREASTLGNPVIDERAKLLDALERARGNRALAARLLGISRATFYRRLADFKIISPEK
jgi:PAS domain S-box-containing protein